MTVYPTPHSPPPAERAAQSSPTVDIVTDAAHALRIATPACTADPIGTNLVATGLDSGPTVRLLHVGAGDATLGLALATPNGLTVAPLDRRAAAPLAAALPTDRDLDLLGGPGDVSAVAGSWTDLCGGGIDTVELFRIYRYRAEERPETAAAGRLEVAAPSHRERAVAWMTAFVEATAGVSDPGGARVAVESAAASGRLLVWEVDGEPVTQLITVPMRFGVVRIGWVYTPPEWRGCGFAAALVSRVSYLQLHSPQVRDVVLNAQATNPVAGRLYRRIGYEAVGDLLRLRLFPAPGGAASVAAARGWGADQ